jgi:hypothetical protein
VTGIPEPLAGRMTVAVRYTAVRDFAEAQRRLAPMRAVAPSLIDAVGAMPYAAIGAVHADPVDRCRPTRITRCCASWRPRRST